MKKILIANRGEIALRIMRSAHEMGIKTVAVYSDADRKSPHVRYANESVYIGQSESSKSYLLGDKIIEICKQLNVDGVHPGYGFLSENAEFAERVEKSGMSFIGPSSYSIKIMGDKLSAKNAVKDYNVPMIEGTDKAILNLEEGRKIALQIGYPILIKASAGGGGKGMRIVESLEHGIEEQMKLAMNEAQSAFGNNSVFIEKYISSPRHIEIQIMGDKHGNYVYLFERECSIQRRHQKVIEEAPSVVLSEELRKQMGKKAIDVARACNYVGAGTVEFLLDSKNNFYFLEMNTRLQVEHPVTELITGIDLVKEQIKVAMGQKLEYTQQDFKIKGHAIEARIYAEDSYNNFMPDIGNLTVYKRPQGAGVRVDDGYDEGMDIPIYYDSMISKLVTYGSNRQEAIDRMKRAIKEYKISGIETTLPFCEFVMNHDSFVSGNYDTHFVKKHFNSKANNTDLQSSEIASLFALHYIENVNKKTKTNFNDSIKNNSNWKQNRTKTN